MARPVPGFHSDELTSHFKLNWAISPFYVTLAIMGTFPLRNTYFWTTPNRKSFIIQRHGEGRVLMSVRQFGIKQKKS
jgi:hypothetical protein